MKKLLFILIATALFACNGTTSITQTSVTPDLPQISYNSNSGIIVGWSATLHPTDSTQKTFELKLDKFSAVITTTANGLQVTLKDTIPVTVK